VTIFATSRCVPARSSARHPVAAEERDEVSADKRIGGPGSSPYNTDLGENVWIRGFAQTAEHVASRWPGHPTAKALAAICRCSHVI
jgi:hypothetical protein